MTRFIILAILYVVLAVYGLQAFRTLFKSPLLHWTYIVLFFGSAHIFGNKGGHLCAQ